MQPMPLVLVPFQASTGFFPFELLYGQQPRGILDVLKEEWESPSQMEGAPMSYLEPCRKSYGSQFSWPDFQFSSVV